VGRGAGRPGPPWVGRKAADTTRTLDLQVVAQVDAQLARCAPRLSWGRLEALIQATVIEADPAAAQQAAEAAATAQGV
jgi:hypothetical protein